MHDVAADLQGRTLGTFVNARIPWSLLSGERDESARWNIAIADGLISAIEPYEPGRAIASDLAVDLEGRWLLPAFVDSHVHLWYGAQKRSMLDLGASDDPLAQLRQWANAQSRVRESSSRWCLGAGWTDSLLAALRSVGDTPIDALSQLVPEAPLFLWSVDHHRALVNRLAHSLLTATVADLDDTGVLVERAAERAWRTIELDGGDLDQHLRELHANGLTAASSFDGGRALDDLLARARAESLPLRVSHSRPWESLFDDVVPPRAEFEHGTLRQPWFKLFLDGTLGSKTAWMFEPYEGETQCGIERVDRDELDSGLRMLATLPGSGLAIHAIGDRAVDESVSLIERLRDYRGRSGTSMPSTADRIEHGQLIAPATLERLAKTRTPLSVQPCHLIVDRQHAPTSWGARCRAYVPLASLTSRKVPIALGTDHPIESLDPWRNLRCATQRRVEREESPWQAHEAITFSEAFAAYTWAAAPLNSLPTGWGTLALGSPADLQVLDADRDLVDIDCAATARVRLTLLGGRVCHSAN